ncbi:MAG: type III-B CRISPR-associated protein Cas10/Cmr2 [Chromatiaceae bacterium]
MATYLLTISLGPVQSLIEAARRTRDLWCGSWLLSEAARAAALALHRAQPGCLIFPCPENPEEVLRPRDRPGDEANIANILRAQIEVPDPAAVAALCTKAKQAAVARLAGLCDLAKARVSGLPFHDDIWEAQRDDILESFAAWTEVKGGDYRAASDDLGRLLAARKATRDFIPAATGPDEAPMYGIPKSSLDAARESVVKVYKEERESPKYRTALRKLGLNRNEQLDTLGVAKRLAGDPEQFTAYSRVAADPWIESLTSEQQGQIRAVYEPLVEAKLATRVSGNGRIYQAIPYDVQLVYDFRLANAKGAKDLTDQDKSTLSALEQALRAIARQKTPKGEPVGAPVPYAAILKADGDHMGALLSKASESADALAISREISRALHGFACRVREIVRQHRGHAIYSGGDDVLALVPLASAVAAADALRQDFAAAIGPLAVRLDPEGKEPPPTLSVGLGIGHLMEPLGRLRKRADAAEKAAKGNSLSKDRQRNALAIQLGIRSGADYPWRARWDDGDSFNALDRFTQAYRKNQLPSRVAYDLRDIGRRLAWLDDQGDAETAKGIRRSEVARMLDRAQNSGEVKEIHEDLRKLILARAASQSLDDLANTLIIARWLSARTAADVGDRP